MKRNLQFVLLIVCLFSTAIVSFAQKPKRRTVSPKPVAQTTKVDLGKLRGNSYTNDFFAMKIEFPLGWLVGDNTLEAQLVQIAKGNIKATNPQNQKAMNAAIERVTPLLGGYKTLPGNPQNSNLRVVVEDLKTLPQIKTGKDYLNGILMSLKATQLPTGFEVSDIESETINNLPLDFLQTSYGGSQKRAYAFVRKGYAVLITIEAYDEVDFYQLHGVLTAADLDYKP